MRAFTYLLIYLLIFAFTHIYPIRISKLLTPKPFSDSLILGYELLTIIINIHY